MGTHPIFESDFDCLTEMNESSESESSGCESSTSERKNTEGPMSMDEGCCICEISDATDVDPLVYCDECNLAVHKLCYGIAAIPDGDWFCNVCTFWKKKRSKDPLCDPKSCPLKCILCEGSRGAMKELHKNRKDEQDRWAHIVCALFIEEVRFHDPETSTGIIIDDIPSSKKVLDGVRGCFYCKKAGFVVKCCCEDKSCGKWFHVTCAQSKQLLLMTDNSALAIESDRSTEFHVFCSQEKVAQMKLKKQKESERQREKRMKEDQDRRRLGSKENPVFSDRNKHEKMAKIGNLQKFAKQRKSITHGSLPNGAAKSAKISEKPTRKRIEKRKSTDETEKERKRSKNTIKQETNMDQITKSRTQLYALFDEMYETDDDLLEKPYIRYQQFIEFLKGNNIYHSIVAPVQRLWAINQKERQLNEKLASLRLTRKFMEQQLKMQDHFSRYQLEQYEQPNLSLTNGYHEEYEGEIGNGSVKSEADDISTESASSARVNGHAEPPV